MEAAGLTAIAIILGILCILLLVVAAAAGVAAFFAMKTNLKYQERLEDFGRFFEVLIETLNEDTVFLRGKLAQTIGADEIPEYRELAHGLHVFQNHLLQIKSTLIEMNLIRE